MLPTIVLVGRPNVGKSTLFNRLTKSRDALVADLPGLTRDRHYGRGIIGERPFLVVDTGGFEPTADSGILKEMARQTLLAIDEADVIIFLVDGRAGLDPQDKVIAERLRKSQRPILLAVNKTEGMQRAIVSAEFHELGLGDPLSISSAHGEGVRDIVELALEPFVEPDEEDDSDEKRATRIPKVAIVGRPNVGKSTLVNALLGEERVIAFDEPGTTRDSIHIDLEKDGKKYTIIDTAGVRKRGKVFEAVEKFSVVKTMQAIEEANVAILVVDAQEGITEQDAHVAAYILDTGRALVVAINKWDGLKDDERDWIKREIDRKLQFLDFAKFHYISALKKKGLPELFTSVDGAYKAAMAKLSTPQLTRVLIDATIQHQPPISKGIRPKLRYAHQGGSNPPIVVVHGNHVDGVKDSYKRFLEGVFRKVFQLTGTPLRVQFNQGANPFADPEGTRKKGEGIVSMRRRKTAQRAELNARKNAERDGTPVKPSIVKSSAVKSSVEKKAVANKARPARSAKKTPKR
ncbi:MAG: ribosome biogenesis GTPase Der [Methylophilaceae bacterium]|uniref:ribosome biogenesis GTPase Der n=1 Tax=Methylovorus sp. MM2 TaxID=1848038 RepID=UPI0007E24C31|nr:ribosome biogenesis GTPase Der [Methylovorus sp. MM2]OAM53121.1 ribosome biogenesis GTPase Der [Methylovorus sp. MM2]